MKFAYKWIELVKIILSEKNPDKEIQLCYVITYMWILTVK